MSTVRGILCGLGALLAFASASPVARAEGQPRRVDFGVGGGAAYIPVVAGGIAAVGAGGTVRQRRGAWGWRAHPFFMLARSPEIDCVGGLLFVEARRFWSTRWSSGLGGGVGYIRTDYRESFGVSEGPRLFVSASPVEVALGADHRWELGFQVFGGFFPGEDDPPIVPGAFINLSFYF